MKNALSEIKRLGKTKPKKPKQIDITEYLNLISLYCYSIIKDADNFKFFCKDEEVSAQVAKKMQQFAETESFFSYVSSPVFAIVTNPKHKLLIPTRDNAEAESENFAVVILKQLASDLETQSAESVCAQAEETIQAFLEATKASMTPELIEKFGDIPI